MTSPRLTGSPDLGVVQGIRSAMRRLLAPSGCFPLFEIAVLYPNEDLESTTDLISRYSGTLESLRTLDYARSAFPPVSATGQYLRSRK